MTIIHTLDRIAAMESKKLRLTKAEIDDITKRWWACVVTQWNTSCQGERICMDPNNPNCPKNSGKDEVLHTEVDNQKTGSN